MNELLVSLLILAVGTVSGLMIGKAIFSFISACDAITKFLSGPAINVTDNRKYIVQPEEIQ